jgi:hypothetical protein
MLEGALLWKNTRGQAPTDNNWYIGENIYNVFNRLTEQSQEGEKPEWLRPVDGILEGSVAEGVVEHRLGKCKSNEWGVLGSWSLMPLGQMIVGIGLGSCRCATPGRKKFRPTAKLTLKELLAS